MAIGIWNSVEGRFVYGIEASSDKAAWAEFRKVYPRRFIPWRYEAREIPKGHVNKKNRRYWGGQVE